MVLGFRDPSDGRSMITIDYNGRSSAALKMRQSATKRRISVQFVEKGPRPARQRKPEILLPVYMHPFKKKRPADDSIRSPRSQSVPKSKSTYLKSSYKALSIAPIRKLTNRLAPAKKYKLEKGLVRQWPLISSQSSKALVQTSAVLLLLLIGGSLGFMSSNEDYRPGPNSTTPVVSSNEDVPQQTSPNSQPSTGGKGSAAASPANLAASKKSTSSKPQTQDGGANPQATPASAPTSQPESPPPNGGQGGGDDSSCMCIPDPVQSVSNVLQDLQSVPKTLEN